MSKKIALHDNIMSIRGTTVALYDYAYYLHKIYGYECIIMYDKKWDSHSQEVIEKFEKLFKVYGYDNPSQIDEILEREGCDYFFVIKGGGHDGVISNRCKNLIMAVSGHISKNDLHGDKYFVCSEFLSGLTGLDYVPHMINLPDVDGDLRSELNIPKDAVVFGRNGGYETFDINFVKDVIRQIINLKSNYYFLFQNTEKFIEHPRVIFLEQNASLEFKVKFINTCDAHLHARRVGESFGLTCGEFSSKNKPIITWNGSPERNHIQVLGEKALLYNDYNDLWRILLGFDDVEFKIKLKETDWNCYKRFYPEPVMERFVKMYEL